MSATASPAQTRREHAMRLRLPYRQARLSPDESERGRSCVRVSNGEAIPERDSQAAAGGHTATIGQAPPAESKERLRSSAEDAAPCGLKAVHHHLRQAATRPRPRLKAAQRRRPRTAKSESGLGEYSEVDTNFVCRGVPRALVPMSLED